MKLTEETLASIPIERPEPRRYHRQHLCLDKGYDYDEVREIAEAFGYTAHIRSRGEEARQIRKDAQKKARRWVAERTHSWLNRFRRILIRWEKKTENYIALLHFVFGLIAYRCSGIAV